jgi:hypothetical protein
MEKNWRLNITPEIEKRVDELLEYLQESKGDIVKEVLKDLEIVEKMKVEEKETYDYPVFKKWLVECTKQVMIDKVDKENEDK